MGQISIVEGLKSDATAIKNAEQFILSKVTGISGCASLVNLLF